jgi:hypothetical protein
MRRRAHEARGVFDVAVELRADRRQAERGLEGCTLSKLPSSGQRRDVRDINDLQEGRRGRGVSFDGNNARSGDEAAYVLESTSHLGGGRNNRSCDKNTTADIRRTFQNDIRLDVALQVSVDLAENLRSDGSSTDRRSGRWSQLDTAARSLSKGACEGTAGIA